jgi:hypothetical protein
MTESLVDPTPTTYLVAQRQVGLEQTHHLVVGGDADVVDTRSGLDGPRAAAAACVGERDYHVGSDAVWKTIGNHGGVIGVVHGVQAPLLHDLVIEVGLEQRGQGSLQDAELDGN